METRTLGSSALDVSRLSLGSWRTFERIGRDAGLEVMRAAREHGITFLDDARYNDETGEAPIPTGYSEVVFGELFREAGWRRDEVVVANKLWWEFWPEQSAAEELDASLERMGFDYLDVAYSWATTDGPSTEEVVEAVGALIATGKLRAWGTGNWEAEDHERAARLAEEAGVPAPCAVQLPYNLTVREYVEGPEFLDAFAVSGAGVVASFVLGGGTLTGKYADRSAPGRMAGQLDDARWESLLRAGEALRTLAEELDTTAAALALAFALANDRVASVLFGATTADQLAANVEAVELLDRLTPAQLEQLRSIGTRPEAFTEP